MAENWWESDQIAKPAAAAPAAAEQWWDQDPHAAIQQAAPRGVLPGKPPASDYEWAKDAGKFALTAGVRGAGGLLDFAADPLAPLRTLVWPELSAAERKEAGPGPGTAMGNAFFAGTGIPESQPEDASSKVLLSGLEGAVGGGPFGVVPAALSALGGIAGQTAQNAGGSERLSTAASLVPGLLAPGIAAVRGRIGVPPENQAAGLLARDIGRDQAAGGSGMDQLRALLEQKNAAAQGAAKPLTLADVGDANLKGRAENLANKPGEGATLARNFLTERDAGAGPRMLNDLGRAFGDGNSAYRTVEDLKTERSATSSPLYKAADEAGPLYSDRLEQFTRDPVFQRGLANGMTQQRLERLASGETFDPANYSVNLDEAGTPSFKPAPSGPGVQPWRPPDIIEFLTRHGGITDEGGDLRAGDNHLVQKGYFGRLVNKNGISPDYAREAAEEARYLPRGSDINDLYDAIAKTRAGNRVYSDYDQSAAGAWQDWRNAQSQAPGGAAKPSGDFDRGGVFDPNEAFKDEPRGWSMQTLHAAKLGLDDQIAAERDPTTGKLSQLGTRLVGVQKAFLNEIDRQNPAYREARAAYAGPSASMDAVKAGSKIFNKHPDEISDEIKGLSPAQRDFYLIGARDAMEQNINKTSAASGNEARTIVGNQLIQNRLRPLFNDDVSFQNFINSAKAENMMHGTFSETLKNSASFRRLAFNEGEKPPGSPTMDALMGMAGLATQQPVAAIPWALRTANSIKNWITHPSASPEANAEMARMLFSSDPTQQAAILDAIQNARGGRSSLPLSLAPTPLPGQLFLPGEHRR